VMSRSATERDQAVLGAPGISPGIRGAGADVKIPLIAPWPDGRWAQVNALSSAAKLRATFEYEYEGLKP